jgi:hypothetical protein
LALRASAAAIFLLVDLAVDVGTAGARSQGSSEAGLPSLADFARKLGNGEPQDLRGIYVPSVFASVVVQQPAESPAYVSPLPNALTAFAAGSRSGSLGFLAHNLLAGRTFAKIQPGQTLYLVYGDGRTVPYVVTELQRFRALDPENVNSRFVGADGAQLSADALFSLIYERRGAVILQTCIASSERSTWGRLFVVAQPQTDTHARLLP